MFHLENTGGQIYYIFEKSGDNMSQILKMYDSLLQKLISFIH